MEAFNLVWQDVFNLVGSVLYYTVGVIIITAGLLACILALDLVAALGRKN